MDTAFYQIQEPKAFTKLDLWNTLIRIREWDEWKTEILNIKTFREYPMFTISCLFITILGCRMEIRL